ncbi:NAD-dependent epimerase/dehydratase family protein [Neorhizobium sp. P12A]|uniref:NmrA family NAD(P)-binding protein n=1 Tax=Neorhizobium sp. P12A TaxID=2268027 RepID=UPI0011F055DD|nr:NmrA family NAD(P)-binding protein [Neorhizobium sp. P12A]KAA0700025.1 NAD-dependent epimerase/dehydratase family protein [Neorhizobium sp. P12A]
MFAVTGITGQVGGVIASRLLEKGLPVRAVVRNAEKGAVWKERGAEIALADMADAEALTKAFSGVDAAFLLIPPTFDPTPGFPEVRSVITALKTALVAAKPKKVVCLSTIGAQATEFNLLNQLGLVEQELSDLPMPIAFLRAGWFMENSAWDVGPAKEAGIIPSFLYPLDKPVPMVAVDDIGALGAEMLQEDWTGKRVVQLEGPARIRPLDIAAAFASALGKPVKAEVVARETWEELFRSQGMKNPEPRMRMLDGFNESWIEFEGGESASLKGKTTIEAVARELVKRG